MSNLFFDTDELFDSHCHLNDHSFDGDRDQVVEAAVAAGVNKIIDISIDLNCSRKAIHHGQIYPGGVFACIGIDPDVIIPTSELYQPEIADNEGMWDEHMTELKNMALVNKEIVVAIGETGIDGNWVNRISESEPKSQAEIVEIMDKQERLFIKHLELGAELGLPLSVHSRAAEKRCLEIVKNYPAARGVFHSYTAGYVTAKQILDAGWALGLNGIITFRNATDLRETYRKIIGKLSADASPADLYAKNVYLETDGPYLAPEGHRGERNEPANVKVIWDFLLKNFG